ncbi:TetR/AcrR family transcriptional regulator [Marinobacter salarius]|uniref:TetR/AcrR family transcriptional regulator n=1 Tax=Marinobacter salarius TaxID=1420917 RepID=UPI0032F09B28
MKKTEMKMVIKEVLEESAHGESIVEAAIRCFDRFGVAKTTVDDIAAEAGIARATVYRTVSNRDHLYSVVSYKILGDIAAEIKPIVDRQADFSTALIRGSIESVRRFRASKVGMLLLEATGDLGVERFLIDPQSPVVNHMLLVFRETFKRAREGGALRRDLSDREAAAWIRSFIFILVLSSNLSKKEQESAIRKFLIPSLVTPP